jgi:hypothetical protein
MRITKRTNIAMRLLMFCGAYPDRLVTKSECRRSNRPGKLSGKRTAWGKNTLERDAERVAAHPPKG